MTDLSIEEKIALSDYRMQKSKETYHDAETNFRNAAYKTSVNRSYYAVLHAARAILILKGIDPLRHDSVKTMISLHYIKTGALPEETVRIFKHLISLRTDVDYGDFESITINDAEDALRQSKRFIDIVGPVREKLVKELSENIS